MSAHVMFISTVLWITIAIAMLIEHNNLTSLTGEEPPLSVSIGTLLQTFVVSLSFCSVVRAQICYPFGVLWTFDKF